MIGEASSAPHWRDTVLGEVGSVSGGGTPSTKVSDYWDGEIFWLVPSEVTKNNGLFISQTERRITSQGLVNSSSKLMPSGTVLMTSRATIGEVVINSVPMATNQGFINIRCSEGVFNQFLAFWIKWNKRIFEERAHGVTFKEITKSNFKTIPIHLPPFAEQCAIARTLRAVQEAKEARQRELTFERERKAALMAYLFTRGTRGEARKQTEIGEMPESWRVSRIDDIGSVISGGTPNRTMSEYWGGDISWVKTGEINYNIIKQTKEKITQAGLNNSSARIIPKNTLLMAMYGQGVTRGRVAMLGIDAAINQACAAIRLADDISPDFLFYFLTYSYQRIRNLGHGANQKNLNAALIRSIVIPLTSQEEQKEIARVLRFCDSKIDTLEKESELLEELFRVMLERLMTGRLSAIPIIENETPA